MRFWQAVVVAQMTAGSVWADKYEPMTWGHAGADVLNALVGFLAWYVCTLFWPVEKTSISVVVNSDNMPS